MHTNPSEFQRSTRHILLSVALIALFFTPCSFAQVADPATNQLENTPADYFRIELILFKVLNGGNNGKQNDTIKDYSDPIVLQGESALEDEQKDIEPLKLLRSETMENAWSRLKRSRNFRPLTYQQWGELRADTVSRHAPGGLEGKAIRVHGENILAKIAKENVLSGDNLGEYSQGNLLEDLIKPEPVYKLDGRATFGQGRFLHIKLDFEYRELNPEAIAAVEENTENKPSVALDNVAEANPGTALYTLFSLIKTRQIVPQKVELFDNEQFGVLVYLEEISIVEETSPDSGSPLDESR